jgi:hypothetical protein
MGRPHGDPNDNCRDNYNGSKHYNGNHAPPLRRLQCLPPLLEFVHLKKCCLQIAL